MGRVHHLALIGAGAMIACAPEASPPSTAPALLGEFEGVAGLGVAGDEGYVRLAPAFASAQPNPNLLEDGSYAIGETPWTAKKVTVSGGQAAPDGSTAGRRIVTSGNGAQLVSLTSSSLPAGTYTFSWYARLGETTGSLNATYAIVDGNSRAVLVAATPYQDRLSRTEWRRVMVTFTLPSPAPVELEVIDDGNKASVDVYLWGAKLEAGSTATGIVNPQVVADGQSGKNPAGTLELYSTSPFALGAAPGCAFAIQAPMMLKSYYREALIDTQVQVTVVGGGRSMCGPQATPPVGSPAVASLGGLVDYGDLPGSTSSTGATAGGQVSRNWAFDYTNATGFSIKARVFAHVFPPPPNATSSTASLIEFTIDSYATGAWLQLCSDPACSSLLVRADPPCPQHRCSYTPSGLTSGQTYYWRAYNKWGDQDGTAPSDVQSFTVP